MEERNEKGKKKKRCTWNEREIILSIESCLSTLRWLYFVQRSLRCLPWARLSPGNSRSGTSSISLGSQFLFRGKLTPGNVSRVTSSPLDASKNAIYIYIYTRRPPAFVGWQTRCEISRCILSGERVAQSVRYCRGGGGGGGLNAFVEVAMALRITRHPFCKLSMLYPFVPSFLFASFLLLASSTFISSLYKTPFLHLPRIDIEFSSRYPSLFFFPFVSLCLSPLLPFILIFIIDDLLHFFFVIFARFFRFFQFLVIVYLSLYPSPSPLVAPVSPFPGV